MKRTPAEIREAIYNACNGDWTDEDYEISRVQQELIQRLLFVECPPEEGWNAAFNRQVKALADLPEPEPEPEDEFLDLMKPIPEPTPKEKIKYIHRRLDGRLSWDVEAIDEYIQRHTIKTEKAEVDKGAGILNIMSNITYIDTLNASDIQCYSDSINAFMAAIPSLIFTTDNEDGSGMPESEWYSCGTLETWMPFYAAAELYEYCSGNWACVADVVTAGDLPEGYCKREYMSTRQHMTFYRLKPETIIMLKEAFQPVLDALDERQKTQPVKTEDIRRKIPVSEFHNLILNAVLAETKIKD